MPAPGSLKSKELQEQARANRARENEERRRTDETIRSNYAKENVEKGKVKIGPFQGNLSLLRGMSNKDGAPAANGYIQTKTLGTNDPAWYNQVPGLVENVANISFNLPTGAPFNTYSMGSVDKLKAVPGIMRVDYLPTFGPFSDSAHSEANPFNVAANALYASIRSKNSGAVNYAPIDVLMVMGAMDSIYAAMAELHRLYAIISNYSGKNWYVGKALMESTGYSDVAEYARKLADFRARYNTLVAKVNSIHIPAGLPLFARHSWMNVNLYADNPSDHFQIIYFQPKGYYQYFDNIGVSNLNGLQFRAQTSISGLIEWVDSQLNELMTNTDVGVISGDILKAFDEGGLIKMETIPEIVPLVIAYSPEVNNQIDNATVYKVDVDVHGILGLYQTTNGIPYYGYAQDEPTDDLGLKIKVGDPLNSAPSQITLPVKPVIINSYDKGTVSPDEVMVYTRLTSVPERYIKSVPVQSGSSTVYQRTWKLQTYGTEVVTDVSIFVITGDSKMVSQKYSAYFIDYGYTTQHNEIFCLLSWLSTFFHYPKFNMDMLKVDSATIKTWEQNNIGTANDPAFFGFQNLDNFAVVDADVIDKCHRIAQISELGIAQDYTKKFRK